MNVWLVMALGGVLTFAIRFSFVWWLGRAEVPSPVRRALRFVPPAVLSAIAAPELALNAGRFDLTAGNIRLIAGLAAILVAAWTKNSLLTILAGLVVLVLLQTFGG